MKNILSEHQKETREEFKEGFRNGATSTKRNDDIEHFISQREELLYKKVVGEIESLLPEEAVNAEAVELNRSEPNGVYTLPFADGLIIGWNSYRDKLLRSITNLREMVDSNLIALKDS